MTENRALQRRVRRSVIAVAIAIAPGPATAPRAADLAASAQGFFSRNCVVCHDPETRKAGLDLTSLPWNGNDPETFDQWVEVFDKVDSQKMPPPQKKRPDPALRAEFLKALRTELRAASLAKQQSEGRVVLRRLNRLEYENTLHDLLSIDVPLQHYLPEDTTQSGFDNVALGLRLSMLHMEQYLEAADAAISAAMQFRRQPEVVKKRLRYHDEESIQDDIKKKEKKTFRVLPDAVVIFDDNSPTVLRQWIVQTRGRYRIRISGRAYQAAGRPVWLKLYSTDFKTQRLLAYFDMPAEEPRLMEVVTTLETGTLLNLSPFDTNYDDQGRRSGFWGIGAETYPGRGIAIEWVEVEGPLVDCWPPPSVGRLFGELPVKPKKPVASDRGAPVYTITPDDPRSAAASVLRAFAARAWRRPVTTADVERYVKLACKGLDDGLTFENALRAAFRAVITSPRFLFLEELPGRLDDWALASRLSYFLWSTLPDDELRKLAADGTLHQPAILRSQVERLLASPKATAFVESFVGQWLDLRQIDFTLPDRKMYPEFDDILKAAMVGETQAFFAQLLRDDSSLNNFIHSDFLMLNRCIAEHYKIDGVTGEEFRRVPLPAGSHRGGVLTQASVLKVTANGTFSSPVLRGAWVMRRLLGEPPAPPPADLPAFEPDTRGATSIRQQLAKHRALASCASCHARMDPPGFALENFDVIGGWRQRYRAETGDSPPEKFRGRRIWEYRLGPPVDASGALLDGRKFKNIDDFKQLLLEREDQVARNLTQNLLTYATGAGIQFADRDLVEAILARLKSRGGGLRTVVHEIVQSPTFQCK
jgi:mono/diheme cytochrome c family protein/cytochrome c553